MNLKASVKLFPPDYLPIEDRDLFLMKSGAGLIEYNMADACKKGKEHGKDRL